MRLRVVGYQVQVRLRTLLPCFHKAHIENLALMVVGMVFAQSVSLPAVARYMPPNSIHIEGRVQRVPTAGRLDGLQNVLRQAGMQRELDSTKCRLAQLRTPLRDALQAKGTTSVMLYVPKKTTYQQILKAGDVCQSAGADCVNFEREP